MESRISRTRGRNEGFVCRCIHYVQMDCFEYERGFEYRCDLESTKRPSMQGMSPGHISIPTPLTKHR